MVAVDTSVLVRILIDDEAQRGQVVKARSFAKKVGSVFVSQIVQIELVWVLEAAYRFPHQQVLSILEHLFENSAFVLQNEDEFSTGLKVFKTEHKDFSDCLIYAESLTKKCELVTFDKKFSRLPCLKLL